eukprot:scaffold44711_cov90-Cyclotella_meneghiniana.AAC.1
MRTPKLWLLCLSVGIAGNSVKPDDPWNDFEINGKWVANAHFFVINVKTLSPPSSHNITLDATSLKQDTNHGKPILLLSKHHKKSFKHKQNKDQPMEYNNYSCGEINHMEKYLPSHKGSNMVAFDRCNFAKTCDNGDGILFPSLFCTENSASDGYSFIIFKVLLIFGLSLVLLMLFRLLNSTTDEFFSPGLELFSLHLGLPPRFAGVTLLALGNGAPDIASTANAMLNDQKHGYLLALGELTGTTMFVSAVILGFVIHLGSTNINPNSHGVGNEKDGESKKIVTGVPFKAPFLRDIAVLCLITVISMLYFHRGVIDYTFVHAMMGVYVAYVLLVLGADAYHILYHLPNLTKDDGLDTDKETEQFISVEYGTQTDSSKAIRTDPANAQVAGEITQLVHLSSRSDGSRSRKHRHNLGDAMIEALSNYSCQEEQQNDDEEHNNQHINTALPPARSLSPINNYSPTSKPSGWGPTSPDGTEALVTFHPHHAIHPHHDGGTVVFRRASSRDGTVTHAESWESTGEKKTNDATASISGLKDDTDDKIVRTRPANWNEAWKKNIKEWNDHWVNPDNSRLDVILLSVELPFTVLRKLVNPVPCDGYYSRPLVAVSLALSPSWVPMTLYGFAISATLLDAIADKLVELLELFGILLRIPTTIMGLTVLAFGNSVQDLVANISISKKGLNTMALTAWCVIDLLICLRTVFRAYVIILTSSQNFSVHSLAGPIFNMCIGLGGGFWVLLKSTGKDEIHVKYPSNIKTGFYFTIANCILLVVTGTVIGRGVIGRGYGYVACGLYIVYVVTSLVVV